jgi:acyl-CoA thioester hydrolase
MLSVHKNVMHPWMCDAMGHLTTRFYLALFDDASYHLLLAAFRYAPNAPGFEG